VRFGKKVWMGNIEMKPPGEKGDDKIYRVE